MELHPDSTRNPLLLLLAGLCWGSQHRYLKHVMEVAEIMQLKLPGIGGKCSCIPSLWLMMNCWEALLLLLSSYHP